MYLPGWKHTYTCVARAIRSILMVRQEDFASQLQVSRSYVAMVETEKARYTRKMEENIDERMNWPKGTMRKIFIRANQYGWDYERILYEVLKHYQKEPLSYEAEKVEKTNAEPLESIHRDILRSLQRLHGESGTKFSWEVGSPSLMRNENVYLKTISTLKKLSSTVRMPMAEIMWLEAERRQKNWDLRETFYATIERYYYAHHGCPKKQDLPKTYESQEKDEDRTIYPEYGEVLRAIRMILQMTHAELQEALQERLYTVVKFETEPTLFALRRIQPKVESLLHWQEGTMHHIAKTANFGHWNFKRILYEVLCYVQKVEIPSKSSQNEECSIHQDVLKSLRILTEKSQLEFAKEIGGMVPEFPIWKVDIGT